MILKTGLEMKIIMQRQQQEGQTMQQSSLASWSVKEIQSELKHNSEENGKFASSEI